MIENGIDFLTEFLIEKPFKSYTKNSRDQQFNLIGIPIGISIGDSNAIESGPRTGSDELLLHFVCNFLAND